MSNRRNTFYLLILFSLLAWLVSGRAFLLHLAYVGFGVLAGAFVWSWMAINWVSIARYTQTRRAQVGQALVEHFSVRNTGLVPKLWLAVLDHSSLPHHNASHVVPTLLPRRRYAWQASTVCTRRGVFTLGPMTVLSGDPFGLFQFPRRIEATAQVIVYPLTVPIHRFATPIGPLTGGHAIRRRAHFITTNAAGVREYQPGDSFNRIHWRSTARRRRLMVKEFELDPLGDVWIFLDLSRASLVERPEAMDFRGLPPQLPPSTAEYGIVAAASLAQYFVDKGRALGFVTYSPQREIVQPDRGPRQLLRVLEILAVARSESDQALQHMLALEAHLLGRGTTAIIVTASQDPAWAAEAYALARRGVRLIAVLIDPVSFGAPPANHTDFRAMVEAAGALVYTVQQDDDLTAVLSYTPTTRLHAVG